MAHRRKVLVLCVVFGGLLAVRGGQGSLVIGAILIAFGLVIQRRPRLEASNRGLVVANLTRTARIPWSDVRGMRIVWFGLTKCLAIETRTGKVVRSYVVTDDPRAGYSSPRFRQLLDELATVEEARGIESALRADDHGLIRATPDTSRMSRAIERLNWAVPIVVSLSFTAVGAAL